jgi:hypothetical protein
MRWIDMIDVSKDELKRAIESRHAGTATFVQSVHVDEKDGDTIVWAGSVHIFNLANNPLATCAYAWSSAREDGKRRFYALLHMGPVTGPVAAVRAAIVAEQKCVSDCHACAGFGWLYEMHPVRMGQPKPPPRICADCLGTGLLTLGM